LNEASFAVTESEAGELFDICIRLEAAESKSLCRIAGDHTNVVRIEKDGQPSFEKQARTQDQDDSLRQLLTIEKIVEFADLVQIEDVQKVLDRQIQYNMDIAREGMTHDYGARIGQVLLETRGNDTVTRARAWAAAASDARMGGCEKPVVINSGSGNQGITASVPVIVYAQDLGATQEQLYRALVVSNLVTVHLKSGIGPLSAYCGAISAGCGCGAGIAYLRGGRYYEIAHTIVNAVAIVSGTICDGAKPSCGFIIM
jgi:L-cysteine desulfidase